MKTIATAFGVLYIEEEHDREERYRIKIYDSEHRYFDYYNLDNLGKGETIAGLVAENVQMISACKTADELLEKLGIDYFVLSEDWTDLLEDMYNGAEKLVGGKWIDTTDGSEITEVSIMGNEWVNKIGSTYILVCE